MGKFSENLNLAKHVLPPVPNTGLNVTLYLQRSSFLLIQSLQMPVTSLLSLSYHLK